MKRERLKVENTSRVGIGELFATDEEGGAPQTDEDLLRSLICEVIPGDTGQTVEKYGLGEAVRVAIDSLRKERVASAAARSTIFYAKLRAKRLVAQGKSLNADKALRKNLRLLRSALE